MKYFTYTNIGPRDINEDSFFATIKDGTLYACIADGVGGMDYGDIVSKFATKLFSEELIRFRNNQLQVSNDINERLTKYINDELTGANAATTFTAGVIYSLGNCEKWLVFDSFNRLFINLLLHELIVSFDCFVTLLLFIKSVGALFGTTCCCCFLGDKLFTAPSANSLNFQVTAHFNSSLFLRYYCKFP